MIIGLVGFIGAGKGAAGDILHKSMGFEKESFAGHVKDISSIMFGWDRDLLEGDTAESREFRETPDPFWSQKFGKEFSPRTALQLIGTEVGREIFHKDFWVQCLEQRIISATEDNDYVITDVRFPNEIDWIRSQGGIIVEIHRGLPPPWIKTAIEAAHGGISAIQEMTEVHKIHSSEWSWLASHTDYSICNDGTLVELEVKIENLLTRHQ